MSGGTWRRAGPSPATELHPDDASTLLERQMDVLELLSAAAPLREVLTAIIASLEQMMPGARCSVLTIDAGDGTLRHGAAPSLCPAYLRAIDGLRPGPSAGSCGTAVHEGHAVLIPDIRIDDRWSDFRDAALDCGLVACWSTPIRGPGGHIVGTFAVYHGYPHEPSDRERRLVDRFTDIASVAIEHSRLIDEVVESEELFRRSFEDNPAGEVLCDLNRRVERANAAFCALSGYPAEKLIGTSIGSVLCLSADTEARIQLMLTAGGACVTRQSVVITADGSECPVEATVSVIRDRNGSPARLAFNVLDLTERLAAEAHRQAHREADVARQIAEEHSRAKSALLTSVSHEIRTPLQAIRGFTELLATLELGEERRHEALSRINTAADHLLGLVTDVLDISRAEANALPLRPERVELAGSIDEVVDLTSELAAERAVCVRSRLDDDEWVLADPDRLRQVLFNLIGNAIRHGRRRGTVMITSSATDTDVLVAIADDGPGIPEDLLDRIFTPFTRGIDAASEPVDGYGLGLMLSHGLASAMGGDLSAGNADSGGAVFTLRLPRAVDIRSRGR
ncbi:PAS domain S-box-containing protein [Gordonia amarae]|nr:ATP-binding protein [Gordonia amarae]MCS3880800.1 PAS domain S-box-containing protein [Gordonia amarae]